MTTGWSQIDEAGNNLFFYRNDGLGAVGHIDGAGKFQQTDTLTGMTTGWSQIEGVGDWLFT